MESKKMIGNCILLIIISLHLMQLNEVLATPIPSKNAIDINSMENDDEIQNENYKDNILFDSSHHSRHLRAKREQKRMADNGCGGILTGRVQMLNAARHRQAAMNFLKEVILASKIELITNNIDVTDFHELHLHSYRYDFLKPTEKDSEPNLSDWYHNMQMYTHTFQYLHAHQKKTRKNPDLTKELEELKITSEKILCEIQSIARHLEENPTLKSITTNEKKTIEDNLKTKRDHKTIHDIDLKFAKVLHFDNIHGMTESLTKCMKDCTCVKGYGECKSMTEE